jgi:hypothetical protein
MKKSDIAIVGGLLSTLATGRLVVGEREFCRPNCEAVLEPPHVPHEYFDPTPVREMYSFAPSGQNVAAPFFAGSDGSDAVRIGWVARYRAQLTIAGNSTSVPSGGVLWFASTEAKKP